MPITPINFLSANTQKFGIESALEDAMKGYAASRLPRQFQQEERQRDLAARLTEAQAKKEEMFGGLSGLSGAAKDVASYELSKKIWGEDSPITKQIKDIMDEDFEHMRLLNQNYRNLNATAAERYSSALGKKIIEGGRAARGLPISPLLQEPLTPEESAEYAGQYENLRTKETTDPKLRQQLIAGENMEITKKSINPDKAFPFAGLPGKAKKLVEQGKVLLGEGSEDYAAFEEEMTKMGLWAKQVRQFYGDSITAGVQNDLKNLTNPQYWSLSPEIAKRKFEQLSSITERELNTLRSAAKSPSIYRGTEIPRDQSPLSESLRKQESVGLKGNPDALTEKNLMATAKRLKWSPEKIEWVRDQLMGGVSNG